MNISFLKKLSLALIFGTLLCQCSTVPVTGRKQFNILSDSQASRIGLTEFNKIKRTKKRSTNPKYNTMTQNVARRLTKVIKIQNPQWEFVVFEDSTPNAFALPGGKIGINSGLFQITDNEAKLAAVIGHEIAHIVAKHGGERVSLQLGTTALGALLGAYLNQQEDISRTQRTTVLAAYGAGSVVGVNLPYSRKHEIEADSMGAIFMAQAGYDPRESIALWQKFAAYRTKKGNSRKSDFLSTHPLDNIRIQHLQQSMPRALAEYYRVTGKVIPLPEYNRLVAKNYLSEQKKPLTNS